MSLKESPNVLSTQISGARHYLRPFGIYITGNVRKGEWLEIKAQHDTFGPVAVFVSLEAASAEYILTSVIQAFITRIYTLREQALHVRGEAGA